MKVTLITFAQYCNQTMLKQLHTYMRSYKQTSGPGKKISEGTTVSFNCSFHEIVS